jgi:uncharacterized protein
MKQVENTEIIPGEWRVKYNYSTGKIAGQFFEALRSGRILATTCSKSGRAYLPPRAYCENAFEPCDGWKEAGMEGTLEAATIVTAQFDDLPKPPYVIAFVRLDGVTTAMANFVRGEDLSNVPEAAKRLVPGTRVRVVFEDAKQGRMTDFHYERIK